MTSFIRPLIAGVAIGFLFAAPTTAAAGPGQTRDVVVAASAYNAARADDAAPSVTFYPFRHEQTAWRMTSGVAAQNAAAVPSDIELSLRDPKGGVTSGLPGLARAGVGPAEAAWFWARDLGLSGEWLDPIFAFGTATVDGGQPLLAVLFEVSLEEATDTVAFRGRRHPGRPDARREHAFPILENTRCYQGGDPETCGESGVFGLNLDPDRPAQVELKLHPIGGGAIVTLQLPPVAPGADFFLYPPALPRDQVPEGRYAGVLTADVDVAAWARTDWPGVGRAEVYDDAIPAADLALPLVFAQPSSACSTIAIQNPSDATDASVELQLASLAGGGLALQTQIEVPSRRTRLVELCEEPYVSTLPVGFAGSARIVSAGPDVAVTARTVMRSDVHPRGAMGGAGIEGQPVGRASARLLAPLVQSGRAHAADTVAFGSRLAVYNPGSSPVDVTATYHGAGGCAGRTVTDGPRTIPPASSALFETAADRGGPLPSPCIASAQIDATGGAVLATVLTEGIRPVHVAWLPRVSR